MISPPRRALRRGGKSRVGFQTHWAKSRLRPVARFGFVDVIHASSAVWFDVGWLCAGANMWRWACMIRTLPRRLMAWSAMACATASRTPSDYQRSFLLFIARICLASESRTKARLKPGVRFELRQVFRARGADEKRSTTLPPVIDANAAGRVSD